jgi:glutamine amidotransferase
MCELFGLSARLPTTVRLSIEELARHGGATGPHRDGWGIGFYDAGDALVVREPEAAHASGFLACARLHAPRSQAVIAHIRKATQGERLLRNTQPFARELGGRMHLFAHNGMLPGIEDDPRFEPRRFRRIGDTDSEWAWCALLDRLAPLWEAGVPSVTARAAVIRAFAAEVRPLGQANFLYTDGDAIFAHGHRRKDATGEVRPPGLHVLCRTCTPESDGAAITGVAIGHDVAQHVALVASVPLSAEPWRPLGEGELLVLRGGQIWSDRQPWPQMPIR